MNHICGDPNSSCDQDCVERYAIAKELDRLRETLLRTQENLLAANADKIRLQEENARLKAAVESAREVISGLVYRTENWNESIQSIIGRQPDTGIHLQPAKDWLVANPEEPK